MAPRSWAGKISLRVQFFPQQLTLSGTMRLRDRPGARRRMEGLASAASPDFSWGVSWRLACTFPTSRFCLSLGWWSHSVLARPCSPWCYCGCDGNSLADSRFTRAVSDWVPPRPAYHPASTCPPRHGRPLCHLRSAPSLCACATGAGPDRMRFRVATEAWTAGVWGCCCCCMPCWCWGLEREGRCFSISASRSASSLRTRARRSTRDLSSLSSMIIERYSTRMVQDKRCDGVGAAHKKTRPSQQMERAGCVEGSRLLALVLSGNYRVGRAWG